MAKKYKSEAAEEKGEPKRSKKMEMAEEATERTPSKRMYGKRAHSSMWLGNNLAIADANMLTAKSPSEKKKSKLGEKPVDRMRRS